jgi:hypothetical protein
VLIFPPIKTEQEVRLWVLCVWGVGSSCFWDFYCPKKKIVKLQ